MPRCPQCCRWFKDKRAVLAHIHQPRGSCFDYREQSRSLSDDLKLHRHRKRARTCITQNPETLHPQDSDVTFSPTPEDMGDSNGMGVDDPVEPRYFVESFQGAGQIFGTGKTFLDQFDKDNFAQERIDNIYYPFASQEEWELASYLLRSGLSMAAIDKFLSLYLIKKSGLSFRTARELRGRAEMLPGGPEWKCKRWTTNIPTKKPISLFYRNPLECIQSLLHNPLLNDHFSFTPMRLFDMATKAMRTYTEWMTGDAAWSMQEKISPGGTLLGTVLSSDKTNLTAMTGGQMAHPLLLSLANIDMKFRMKSSNHGYILLALLPVPKFLHRKSKIRGVLEARLIHECLDFILQPLKIAARIGTMMSDPLGNLRYVYTGLAAYIVDTPESALLSGVAGMTSSVTMATYKEFGDAFQHEPRTASTTIAQLHALEEVVDPWDLETYTITALERYRLGGVHRPFWRDWPMAEPSEFLTPEPLHHWHKMFWDHDAKWCIHAVGSREIDFRFSVLHPHTAYRHFREGVSALKQVTGREHRDLQRYIVGVTAGAVSKRFLVAIRALVDFRYLAQAPEISDEGLLKIDKVLREFHKHKDAIVTSGARNGKKNATKDWHIPKLEFMQSVTPNIRHNGVAMQWSADVTERAHITEIKIPAESTNNENYEPQICRYLDHAEKCRLFNLATALRDASVDFRSPDYVSGDSNGENEDPEEHIIPLNTTTSLLEKINPVNPLVGTTRINTDYFRLARELELGLHPTAPQPFRTFLSGKAAIHLVRDPSFKRMTVEQVADQFNLPDLSGALADYISLGNTTGDVVSGRRVVNQDSPQLSIVKALEVWTKVRIQNRAYHPPHDVLPAQTVNASPPSRDWPAGRSDAVIINTDPTKVWPVSGFEGHRVAQIRLIFRIISTEATTNFPGGNGFLAYMQQFDIIPQINREVSGSGRKGPYPDPISNMYCLKRTRRSDNTIKGDVIVLARIRVLADLIPRFGEKADPRLSKQTVLEYGTEFFLNKYLDKELFYALD